MLSGDMRPSCDKFHDSLIKSSRVTSPRCPPIRELSQSGTIGEQFPSAQTESDRANPVPGLDEILIQCAYIVCPKGNGNRLSKSQACCLAQLCLAAAEFLSISGGANYLRALYSMNNVSIITMLK